MNINKVLNEVKKDIQLNEETLNYLKKQTEYIVELLEEEIVKKKIDAEIFIGGSFAKGTLIKKEKYDVDVFVRFDWRIDNISAILEKIVRNIEAKAGKANLVHGSRDYFIIERKVARFEIIPVYRIKKQNEARNVTDLSYFHINYVKRKLNKQQRVEVMLAKKFCEAQQVYGAESYVNGFSGYALECLIINYKSFIKMLKELTRAKERVILDPAKYYKNKNEILFSLNENKLQSPVVLVDPTWKERNVLAALNKETFLKFQDSSKKFLKNPSVKFFEKKEFELEKLEKYAKSKRAEFLHLDIETDKQEGDIAGTKMKKFSRFFEGEIRKYFDILEKDFVYFGRKKSEFYLVVKPKNKIVFYGPPLDMKDNVREFKKKHKNAKEKKGKLYSEMKVNFTAKSFLGKWINENRKKMNDMGLVGMRVR